MSLSGTIYNIQQFSIHDGPGIRTTVFFQGCPLACWWCHNPESRPAEIVKFNGKKPREPYSPEGLLKIITRDRIFYDQSGGGVTFSGGEPMSQVNFLQKILQLCKNEGIHTAVDTSGYASKASFEKIKPYTDLFLYDLKIMEQQAHKKYMEVSNSKILENLSYLMDAGAQVVIRIPLIPDLTASTTNLEKIINFLTKFSPAPEINLLPYHKIAEGKYDKLNLKNYMNGSRLLSQQEIDDSLHLFTSSGFRVKIGG